VQRCHGAPEDLGDRVLQPLVGVGDDQLHADQAARDQALDELRPERLGLGSADVEADDLATPRVVHAVGDDHALALHAAAVADLLDLGVEEQIDVAALQRPRAERLDLLIQPSADAADLAAANAQPQTLSTSWSTRLVDTPHT